MSTTVLRCDAESMFQLVCRYSGFIQLFEDKHFRSPSYWQQGTKHCVLVPPEPLWSIEETASLQTQPALTALLHVRKTDCLEYEEKSRQLVPSLVFPGRDLKFS